MPRVDAYKEKYLVKDFSNTVKRKMFQNCTQDDLAKKFGITRQGVCSRINKGTFSFLDLIKLFNILEFTDEEILTVMGRRKKRCGS